MEGQTDEEELGLSYQLADEILERFVDKKQSLEEMLAEGYEEIVVQKVIQKIKASSYKRKIESYCKGRSSIGKRFYILKEEFYD